MVAVFSPFACPDILFHAQQFNIVQFKIFTPKNRQLSGRALIHTHTQTDTLTRTHMHTT